MDNQVQCLHCNELIYYHRIISHTIKNHFDDINKRNRLSIKRCDREQSSLVDITITDDGHTHKCCLGCNKAFNKEFYANKHIREHKECKKKHLEVIAKFMEKQDNTSVEDSSEEVITLKKLLIEANKKIEEEKKKYEKLQTKCDNLDSQVDESQRFRNVLIGVCKTLQDNGENIMEFLTPIITEKNEMYGEDHTHVIDDVLQEIE